MYVCIFRDIIDGKESGTECVFFFPFFAVRCAVSLFLWARRRAEGEGKSCRPLLSSPHMPVLYCSLHSIHVAHNFIVSEKKNRNKFVGFCARIRCSSQSLVQRLISFKIFQLSVLKYVGSFAEPDKAFIAVQNIASKGLGWALQPYCGGAVLAAQKIDVDGIQLTSKAVRFRVASRSDAVSAGMAHVRAAKDHDGRTLQYCARSWDDLYLLPTLPPPLSDSQHHRWPAELEEFALPQDATRGCCHDTPNR